MPMRSKKAGNLQGISVGILLLVVMGARPVAAIQDAAKPSGRTIKVTVEGPDGKPLPGAKIHAAIWSKEPIKSNRDYVCDENGRATVELPNQIDILRLWASYNGHVSLFANWWPEREARPREIPGEFTFQLETGTVIGGTVRNEEGEPIAGAKVAVMLVNPNRENGLEEHPIPNVWLAEGDACKITDAQGRWSLDTAPAGDAFGFQIMLNHPDYVSDEAWGGLQNEQGVGSHSLRNRSATIVMPRGIQLSGLVTSADGKAIPDAVVIWGDDPYFQQGSQEVRTDAEGRYKLPPLPAGSLRVTVVAPGNAPAQHHVDLGPDNTISDFTLQPGKTLRLHFVDETGAVIPEVGVGIRRWRGSHALYNHRHPNVLDTKIPVFADKNGIYEWTWAPEDDVTFGFSREGFESLDNLTFAADSKTEYEITMSRKPGAPKP